MNFMNSHVASADNDDHNDKIEALLCKLQVIESVYKKLILPPSCVILPGIKLRKHTRGVSWIVQDVLNDMTERQQEALGLSAFSYDSLPDTSLHDCELSVNDLYYVNLKVHDMAKKHTRNDMSSAAKLYDQYCDDLTYDLIYVCYGFYFEGSSIRFDPHYLKVFAAQFLPIYVNPRNHKIQAHYAHQPQYRTRSQFLTDLAAAI